MVEQYDADKAQGIFSNIMPLVALSPALAPILGAYILNELGWRAIFIFVCYRFSTDIDDLVLLCQASVSIHTVNMLRYLMGKF